MKSLIIAVAIVVTVAATAAAAFKGYQVVLNIQSIQAENFEKALSSK